MIDSVRPVALAWSGGKDSVLALERLQADPSLHVAALLTSVTTEYDRVSIHGVRRSLLHCQAAAVSLPLVEVSLGPAPSNAVYEAAFAQGLAELRRRWPEMAGIAFGDLFLEDVRAYREELLARLGWPGLYPIWGEDTAQLARSFVARGYRAVLTCVDTTQLDPAFAGREYDATLLDELPSSVDPCGERGEFHTFVYAGPIFREAVPVRTGARVRREERFEYCDLL